VRALAGNHRKASCMQHNERVRVVLGSNCYIFCKRRICLNHDYTPMCMKYHVDWPWSNAKENRCTVSPKIAPLCTPPCTKHQTVNCCVKCNLREHSFLKTPPLHLVFIPQTLALNKKRCHLEKEESEEEATYHILSLQAATLLPIK